MPDRPLGLWNVLPAEAVAAGPQRVWRDPVKGVHIGDCWRSPEEIRADLDKRRERALAAAKAMGKVSLLSRFGW